MRMCFFPSGQSSTTQSFQPDTLSGSTPMRLWQIDRIRSRYMAVPTSSSLEEQIATLEVAPGTAAVVWLGQGGYLFKSPGGQTIMVDPYFSDYAEPFWGVKRLIPAVIDATRFTPDVLLITHWHEDHLDMDTVRLYAQQPDIIIAGPASCVGRAQ